MNTNTGTDIVIPKYADAVLMEEYAFRRDIKSVSLHNSVTYIGDRAFAACTGLTEIDLPDSVEYMGPGAFASCTGIRSIRIPASMKEIPDNAFAGCISLEQIEIPQGVEAIGAAAFMGCRLLKQVRLPESVKNVAWSAFAGCSDIGLIYEHAICMTGDWYPLGKADNDVLDIPEGVKAVGERACRGNTAIKKAVVPRSVIRIKKDAFAGCTVLEQVIIKNPECRIDSTAFNDCPLLKRITLGDGGTETEIDAADVGCVIRDEVLVRYEGTAADVSVPEGIAAIGEKAFAGCTGLKRLHIPASVKELGGMMFHKAAGGLHIEFEGTSAEWEKMMEHKQKWVNEFMDDGYHHGTGVHTRYLQRIPVMHTGNSSFDCVVCCIADGATLVYGEEKLPPPENVTSYDNSRR